jgi:hypothetical protein
MDRRDFLQGAGLLGALSLVREAAAMGEAVAERGPDPRQAEVADAADSAQRGLPQLLVALREARDTYLTPAYGISRPEDVAEGERLLAHLLHTGLQFFLESDPAHPRFVQYVTASRKLLGDNPDALYYFAPIRGDLRYRIRGNVGAATFTSFTVEAGSGKGHAATGSVAALDDTALEINPDGSFEILLSAERPDRGNWLRLTPDAGQVTTRHYYETPVSVMTNPGIHQDLVIEALDAPADASRGGQAGIEDRFAHVATFVREHMALSIPDPRNRPQLDWVSTVPNQFNPPAQWRSESGYGNLSAWYAMAPFVLGEGQALEIIGRFPTCRFANLVLWNRFMQTFDYTRRRISCNRNQLHYEDDGSFRILVAHRDPGHPNWLATEGRASGLMYWRYLYPSEAPATPRTRVITL